MNKQAYYFNTKTNFIIKAEMGSTGIYSVYFWNHKANQWIWYAYATSDALKNKDGITKITEEEVFLEIM